MTMTWMTGVAPAGELRTVGPHLDEAGVLPCPPWCQRKHPDSDWTEPIVEHECVPDREFGSDVWVCRVDVYDADATITDEYIWALDRNVTPDVARRIARALTAAADVIDGGNPTGGQAVSHAVAPRRIDGPDPGSDPGVRQAHAAPKRSAADAARHVSANGAAGGGQPTNSGANPGTGADTTGGAK